MSTRSTCRGPKRRCTRFPPVRARSRHWCPAARMPMSYRRMAPAVRCSTGAPARSRHSRAASHDVAFSGDGQTAGGSTARRRRPALMTEAVGSQATPTMLALPDTTATPSDMTLDQNGKEAAYLSTNTAGLSEVVVAQVPSGTALAIAPLTNVSQSTLSPAGVQIAYVSTSASGASIEEAPVPGASAVQTGSQIPAAANTTLQQFVQAQVGQNGQPDLDTLATLSAASVDAAASTPQNLSRAYVINTYVQADGVVTASVELIVDPNAAHANARLRARRSCLRRRQRAAISSRQRTHRNSATSPQGRTWSRSARTPRVTLRRFRSASTVTSMQSPSPTPSPWSRSRALRFILQPSTTPTPAPPRSPSRMRPPAR